MKRYLVSILTGAVTLCLLTVVKLKAPYQMLIADRFLPGSGWAEIAALGVYGFFVAQALQKGTRTASVRLKIWLTFSIVFFTQFILGIAGIDSFLMTGASARTGPGRGNRRSYFPG